MAKLRVAILGATGGTGSAVAKHALERGHDVHALVRNVEKLEGIFGGALPSNVTAHKGDATREEDVRALLASASPDVAVIAVGTSSLEKSTVCFDTAVAVARAASRSFYREGRPRQRIIAISGAGLGAKPGLLMEKILVPALLKEPLIDALQMEAALLTPPAEVIDTVIVRPYRLTDGQATTQWQVVPEDYAAPIVIRYTTRADVAQCVMREAESWEHAGKIVNVFTGGV